VFRYEELKFGWLVYSRPTDDELNVQFLSDLLLIEQRRNAFLFSYPAFCYWWGENGNRIDAIKGDIISTAAAQNRPDYQPHLEWCRKMWAKRGNRTPYVPAVTGGNLGELQDWDAPNVMQRRADLRASPLVQAVLRNVLQ
jgi:hypothetical protein